jgi:DNA-binding CsgD family transcriptional regulator
MLARDSEAQILRALVTSGRTRGGALIISGEPGIGKSCLVDYAVTFANQLGTRVLTVTGVEQEAFLPFSGLHQLLRTSLNEIGGLPDPQRRALEVTFGLSDGPPPQLFLVAMATLSLLAECAGQTPLLIVAEDAHWLDASSADLLTLVGRRLQSDPIVMLVEIRDGFPTPFHTASALPEMTVPGLPPTAAEALLDAQGLEMSDGTRARILTSSNGNPLALIELPRGLNLRTVGQDDLPLTARLEQAFIARVEQLPDTTRWLLLTAALNDSSCLWEAIRATELVIGESVSANDLVPATEACLVEVIHYKVRFRHQLVRSALRQAADISSAQAVHRALAEGTASTPDRQAWHLAGAASGTDPTAAAALMAAAERSERRGSLLSAVAALERAAELTPEHGTRGATLQRAAALAIEIGSTELAVRLLGEAEKLELADLDRGRLSWLREMVNPGLHVEPTSIAHLVETADKMTALGDPRLALKLLWTAALGVSWSGTGQDVRAPLVAAIERVPVPPDDPRRLSALAYVSPVDRAADVISRCAAHRPSPTAEPESMWLVADALITVGAHPLADPYLNEAAIRMRDEGRLRPLAQVLALRALTGLHLGRWRIAAADADEAAGLARETAQPICEATALATGASLAGLAGDQDRAARLATSAERVAMPLRPVGAFHLAQLARGTTAISVGRYSDAYDALRPLLSPTPGEHSVASAWIIEYFAEAAFLTGHGNEARPILAAIEPMTGRTPSPYLHLSVRYARAILSDDEHVDALFQQALSADLEHWPFERARLLLAYGGRLRRMRRMAEARTPLREARDAFDALDALPWAERSRQKLRASGERSRKRTPDAREQLSPQEIQIAELAAQGLSNREIGQRLFLSHRTVGSHLYRLFPKLDVTSRAELRRALDGAEDSSHPY